MRAALPHPRQLMHKTSVLTAAILAFLGSIAFAQTSRIVPHSEKIDHPIDEVYGTLKHYFSDESLSQFRLTSENKSAWTLTATRSVKDGANWRNWAACETSPQQMIYQFSEGAATVTVQLEKYGKNATLATINADFQGTYNLGSQETTIACTSKGALEPEILAVAGGSSK
jgi:hypothetical protein